MPVACCNRRGFSAEKQIPALRHAHLKTLHSHFIFKQSQAALTTCQCHAATAVAFPQKSKSPLSAMHTSKPFIPISFSSNRRRLSPLASAMLQPPWLFRRKANPRSPPCTPQNPSFPFHFQAIAGGSHHLPAPCCNRRGFSAEKQIPALRHAHLKTLHSHFNFKQSQAALTTCQCHAATAVVFPNSIHSV